MREVRAVYGCMICREPVAYQAKRKPIPPDGSILPKVCGECQRKYLAKGVLIINLATGSMVIVTDEAFHDFFGKRRIPKSKVVPASEEVIDFIMGKFQEQKIEPRFKDVDKGRGGPSA